MRIYLNHNLYMHLSRAEHIKKVINDEREEEHFPNCISIDAAANFLFHVIFDSAT